MYMKELIENYKPINMQEEKDKEVILEYLSYFDNLLTRDNKFAHFTSSAFIVNQDYTKVLMAYHNIYKSYAWLGGHMDGIKDPLEVAIKEAEEENKASDDTKDHHYDTETKCFIAISKFVYKCKGKCTDYCGTY